MSMMMPGGNNQVDNSRNRNNYVANEELQANVDSQMEQFKVEVAAELGLSNYNQLDKGELTSRQNGYVGGNMTKKMVSYAEVAIAQNGAKVVASTAPVTEIPQRIRLMNQAASQGITAGALAAQNIGQGQLQ